MSPNEKPGFMSPRAVGLAFLIALGVIAVVAVFMLSPASGMRMAKETSGECLEAAEWHYGESLKATPEAEYHFWAGAAAEKLAATGGSCHDWRGT